MTEQSAFGGYVYVICPEDENHTVCKIGVSNDVGARLASLQTGCWTRLRVHRTFKVFGTKASYIESLMHKAAESKFGRLEGEWFGVAAEEAVQLIREACAGIGLTVGRDDRPATPAPKNRRMGKPLKAQLRSVLKDIERGVWSG